VTVSDQELNWRSMMNRMMKFANLLLFAYIGLNFSGCGESVTQIEDTVTPESTGTTEIRFIHSAASTDAIDFYYLDLNTNSMDGIFSYAEYGTQYGYYDFGSGAFGFEAVLSGTNLSGASIADDFEDGGKYSVVAVDFEATLNPALLVFTDTNEEPLTGNTFFRFIHASADAPDIDILGTDDIPLFEDISQYQATDYLEIGAGTYFLRGVSSGTGDHLPEIGAITLLSGVNYTAILSGTVNGLPGPGFNVKMYPEPSISSIE